MYSWFDYYRAQEYLVDADGPDEGAFPDERVARLLGLQMIELVTAGIGTYWVEVHSPDLPDDRTWFTHGEPWCVLLGVAPTDAVVARPDLFEGGMIGPPWLRKTHDQEPIPLDGDHVRDLADVLSRARKAQRRAMSICANCQSFRYDSGCRCDSPHTGIIYD